MSWLDIAKIKTAAQKIDSATAERKNRLEGAIQSFLDTEAQKLGYDSIMSAVTYADESSITQFSDEGKSFRAWRSLVWDNAYQTLADVESGAIAEPTETELIAALPVRP